MTANCLHIPSVDLQTIKALQPGTWIKIKAADLSEPEAVLFLGWSYPYAHNRKASREFSYFDPTSGGVRVFESTYIVAVREKLTVPTL